MSCASSRELSSPREVARGKVAGRPGYGRHMADPVPLSQSLDSVMRSLRGADRVQLGGLFGRWDEAVGEAVAAHVQPIKLDHGVLLVEADDPAWATQVKFLADTIVERLFDVAGVEVRSVEVRVARSA